MKFSAAVVATVLSASAVMAAPGTAARRARNAEKINKRTSGRTPKPLIRANVTDSLLQLNDLSYSTNWAGGVLVGSGYKAVTGTFTIPDPTLPSGGSSSTYYSASAWVGIDGDTCETSILQTGVDFNLQDGEVSFDAWYEWYPDYSYDFTGISFSAGDVVKVTVDATSKTAGKAIVENVTKGTTVTHSFSGETDSLCETNAEWIVEDFTEVDGNTESLVPLVDFGTVTFTDAYATTSSGTVTPADANVIEMVDSSGSNVVASVSVSSSEIVVKYV